MDQPVTAQPGDALDRPLRVCLVSAAYHPYPSGVSEHVAHLAGALADHGHGVEILTTRYPEPHDDAAEPVPVTRFGRVVLVPLNGSYATLPVGLDVPRRVRRFLAERPFDVVHGHGLFPPEIAYWAIRYSRAVNVVTFLSAGFRTHRVGGRAFQRLFRGHLGRIHGRIAISRRAHASFAAYVPGETRIIPCGIDLARFHPAHTPLPAPDPTRPTMLFVGRLDRRKGLSVLLRALPAVVDRVPGARLVVVGGGPEEEASRALAARLGVAGTVRFAGRVSREDLPRYYAGCDLYCAPTLGGEALGIVLLEAMASGAPVVATDIPGYDETVRRDEDALLCPPGDAHALAEMLVRALSDAALRSRLRASGLARAQGYAWPVIAERTVAYYRELMVARRGRADQRG